MRHVTSKWVKLHLEQTHVTNGTVALQLKAWTGVVHVKGVACGWESWKC